MKHIFIAIMLLALSAGLMAQTGLYGIAYGQGRDEVGKMLETKGFKLDKGSDTKLEYSNSAIKGLTRVEISINSSGQVAAWSLYYDTTNNSALKDQITAELEKLHGSEQIWDSLYEEWAWELENEKGAYLYINEENNQLTVDYDFFDYSIYDDYEDYWW